MGGRDIDATWQEVADELDYSADLQERSVVYAEGKEVMTAARYRAAAALRREAARLREENA